MLPNGSLLGTLLGGVRPVLTRPDSRANPSGNANAQPVFDVADSGGVRFDFAAAPSGAGQADDDAALNAYFHAAKWAQSMQAQVAAPDAAPQTSFAAEPNRHDVVAQYFGERTVTPADAAPGAGDPYQGPTFLGRF